MRLRKFTGVDAFVALDLDGAEAASGPVRWARRVLQGGAKDLARSQTYTYAALQMRRSGASAGISAEAPQRSEAMAAFVAEAAALVADGVYLPDAAKGVGSDDLAPLRDGDPRHLQRVAAAAEFDAVSAAVAADAAAGLEGRTAVIEGFASNALAEAIEARGGRVVGAPDGGAVWGVEAGVVFAGSKMGVVNHGVAEGLACRALVPCGRLAFTSKALAVCRRRGIVAVPDFVALAGATIAAWSSADVSDDELRTEIAATTASLMADALASDDGPFLGACYAAESFLSTWQDQLPFGRPLAS